jgi:5-methylcytosine-specific restriction endonuclease McrA
MAVFVLDKKHKPLMPCSEKRAKLLLKKKRARIHRLYPFTIRIIDRTVQESNLQPVRCKIDPGSVTTGIAIVRENKGEQRVISLIELKHRGAAISETLKSRASLRRKRRYNLRYRPPRFNNRGRRSGWIAPSLLHRVQSIHNWVERLIRWTPITAITCEVVSFDTQKILNPEIKGTEYQKGTLFGCEVREYLLEKWERKCAYCGMQNIPLQIDHIIPRSKGGSNRIDNLTLACSSCNQKKGNLPLEIFAPGRAKEILNKPGLRHSAAVNSTREALQTSLLKLSLPFEASTGGQTKYNREYLGIPKSHALDAACTGKIDQIQHWQQPIQQISCTGRGAYQRTRLDRFGFPRGFFTRQKRIHGFQTGDHVVATVPKGKKMGSYEGRVAVRASGSFNIQSKEEVVQGISWKHCKLVQRADGYQYNPHLPGFKTDHNINQTMERRFLPPLKEWVSAPSRR